MKVHYPKLYNMAHLSLNGFTAFKGSNNYILFIQTYFRDVDVFITSKSVRLSKMRVDYLFVRCFSLKIL